MEVVEVFPLLQLVVEELAVVDHDAVERPVELFGVDAMGALDLPIEAGCAGPDVDVLDAPVEKMPVELGLELGAVVRLDALDLEGQLLEDVVKELDCGALGDAGIGTQHPDAGAV